MCQHSRAGGKPGCVKVFDRNPPGCWDFSALNVSECCRETACVESTPDCAAAFTGRSRCFREAEIRYGVHSRHAIALQCQSSTTLLQKPLQTVAILEQFSRFKSRNSYLPACLLVLLVFVAARHLLGKQMCVGT